MVAQYIWWIAAAILVGVEMMTGTFYLLIVALACVVGGIVALMGYDSGWQWGLAAVVEVAGTLAVVRWKKRFMSQPKLSNNLDIGQKVSVLECMRMAPPACLIAGRNGTPSSILWPRQSANR